MMVLRVPVILFVVLVGEAAAQDNKVPNIAGQSEWGTIYQVGSRITITGHEKWDATGEIRADGESVYLLWIERDTNKPAPSVYKLIKDNVFIVGLWGWSGEVVIQKDGSITGSTIADTLRSPMTKQVP